MLKISALIITYNEENNIAACLESLKWVNEIIVVDSGSTDATIDIARNFTDRIYSTARGDFSRIRNEGLKHVTGDWVLILDADERISIPLALEIRELLKGNPDKDGYRIPLRNYFLGKWIKNKDWYPDHKLRLLKFSPLLKFEGSVHERLIFKGSFGYLRNHINHYTYNSIEQFINKTNLYTSLAANDYYNRGRKAAFFHLITRPCSHFTKLFFFKKGFIDGKYGFILCSLMSYYIFLRTLKLWLKYRH